MPHCTSLLRTRSLSPRHFFFDDRHSRSETDRHALGQGPGGRRQVARDERHVLLDVDSGSAPRGSVLVGPGRQVCTRRLLRPVVVRQRRPKGARCFLIDWQHNSSAGDGEAAALARYAPRSGSCWRRSGPARVPVCSTNASGGGAGKLQLPARARDASVADPFSGSGSSLPVARPTAVIAPGGRRAT